MTEALLIAECCQDPPQWWTLALALGTALVGGLTAVVVLVTTWHLRALTRRQDEDLDKHG